MLESDARFALEPTSRTSEASTSSVTGPPPLIQGLRGLFWASGVGGIAVAGIAAVIMALSSPAGRTGSPEPELVLPVDRSSAPRTILTDGASQDMTPGLAPFDIRLYNDPEYLRTLEQIYNPWMGD